MDLLQLYSTVNTILNTVDFNALFEGFHKYRFALYTSEEIIIDGKIIPYQDGFRGNTSIFYEGEYIAIWNLEFDPIDDPEQLAYCSYTDDNGTFRVSNNRQAVRDHQ